MGTFLVLDAQLFVIKLRIEDPLWSSGHDTRLPNPRLGKCFWAKKDSNMWPWTHYSRRKLWVLNLLMSRSDMRCKDLDRQPKFILVHTSWLGIGDWHSFLVRSPSWHISLWPLLQQQQQQPSIRIWSAFDEISYCLMQVLWPAISIPKWVNCPQGSCLLRGYRYWLTCI